MIRYDIAVEIYVGEKIDIEKVTFVCENGIYRIDSWNYSLPQPTLEELETIWNEKGMTYEHIKELENNIKDIILEISNALYDYNISNFEQYRQQKLQEMACAKS